MMLIRPATQADVPAIARIHVDSWRATYRGIVPAAVLDALSYARHFYVALGGQYVREATITVGGAALAEYAYGWSALAALTG